MITERLGLASTSSNNRIFLIKLCGSPWFSTRGKQPPLWQVTIIRPLLQLPDFGLSTIYLNNIGLCTKNNEGSPLTLFDPSFIAKILRDVLFNECTTRGALISPGSISFGLQFAVCSAIQSANLTDNKRKCFILTFA